jgi:hypothetical protein
MKAQCALPLVLLLTSWCVAQQDPAELRKKAPAAEGGECVRSAAQAAHNDLEEANRRFAASDTNAAHSALDASVGEVHRAVECSLHASRTQKKLEIELRKISRRMATMAQALETEERPNLEHAQAEVEKERDRLLHALFGDAAASPAEKKP